MNTFGAIEPVKFVTRIGRCVDADVKLQFNECSVQHGSIIHRADDSWIIINHSLSKPISINDYKLDPGQSISLAVGDIISFSGVL